MITKNDAKDFLSQMLDTEHKMESYYKELIKELTDKRLIATFTSMMHEEQDHAKLVLELMKFTEKWV